MTLGEQRVRVNFNPSDINAVSQLKQTAALLINQIEQLKLDAPTPKHPEQMRLMALAQDAAEVAAMWAVKAATFDV